MCKTCTKCKQTKYSAEFQKNSRYSDGFCSWCKECKKANARAHADTNKRWQAANKDRVTKNNAEYVARNLDRVKEAKALWRKNNPKHALSLCRKYQAAKLNATPSWLTKAQIMEMHEIYKNCPPGHEVDHEIPLQGKDVRGLHVPWNLQYLPISVNRRKSNKLQK